MWYKNKVYIIAEVGINHNGSLYNCYKLIDAAVYAGCDCVKFQFFKANQLYLRSAGKLGWKDKKKRYSYDIYGAVKSFETPANWIKTLMVYCKQKGICFLSSAFDEKGLNYLIHHGIKVIKIASSSITNLPFIEKCARYRLPIIMSTGAATLGEVEEAVRTVNKYHNKLSLLHCSLKYPTKLNECNLGIIKTLRHAFPNNKIGYSDHTQEISKAAVQAVYLGAGVIEKHITLDKMMKGPDHFFALEPRELKKMVQDIRKAEQEENKNKIKIDKKLYGTSSKIIFKHERYLRDFCFPTIFAGRNINRGQRINRKDLLVLRPGKRERGLEPKYFNFFKNYRVLAAKDIVKEEPITWEKIFNA